MTPWRFNPFVAPVDHWRRMRDYNTGRPAHFSRFGLIGVPIAGGGLAWHFDVSLVVTEDFNAVLGLLSGVFLASFGAILTLRMAKTGAGGLVSQRLRASLDESAMALLSASLLAGVAAFFFTAVAASGLRELPVWSSAVAVGLGAVVLLYFILAIGRLAMAYENEFPSAQHLRQGQRRRGAPSDSDEPSIAPGERLR